MKLFLSGEFPPDEQAHDDVRGVQAALRPDGRSACVQATAEMQDANAQTAAAPNRHDVAVGGDAAFAARVDTGVQATVGEGACSVGTQVAVILENRGVETDAVSSPARHEIGVQTASSMVAPSARRCFGAQVEMRPEGCDVSVQTPQPPPAVASRTRRAHCRASFVPILQRYGRYCRNFALHGVCGRADCRLEHAELAPDTVVAIRFALCRRRMARRAAAKMETTCGGSKDGDVREAPVESGEPRVSKWRVKATAQHEPARD